MWMIAERSPLTYQLALAIGAARNEKGSSYPTYPVSPVACVVAVCFAVEVFHHGVTAKGARFFENLAIDFSL